VPTPAGNNETLIFPQKNKGDNDFSNRPLKASS